MGYNNDVDWSVIGPEYVSNITEYNDNIPRSQFRRNLSDRNCTLTGIHHVSLSCIYVFTI